MDLHLEKKPCPLNNGHEHTSTALQNGIVSYRSSVGSMILQTLAKFLEEFSLKAVIAKSCSH